jgi:hypothetical protein
LYVPASFPESFGDDELDNTLWAAGEQKAAYSILGIAVNRNLTVKWLFPQEKATFQCSQ